MVETVAHVGVSAVTYAIDKPYRYRVPPDLLDRVEPGMRVLVPFGRGNRTCDGVVLDITREDVADFGLKDIQTSLDDGGPVLDRDGVRLALWLRGRCFCTIYEIFRAMIPAGLWYALRDIWRVAPGVDKEMLLEGAASPHAELLVNLLRSGDGACSMEGIKRAFKEIDPSETIQKLAKKGLIVRETYAREGVLDRTDQIAVLAVSPEEAMARMESFRTRAPVQYAVAEQMCLRHSASVKELRYFTGATQGSVMALVHKGIITVERRRHTRSPMLTKPFLVPASERTEIMLNEEQQAAFAQLDDLTRTGKPEAALLYGVTGSGKTQVYIKLIQSVLDRGKTALMLVPEIGLTPQLLRQFAIRFGDQVALLHSGLTPGERCDEWKRVKEGEARVVLGTRSAAFAPLTNLGVIIMDEEQEAAYKSENTPRYHARDVARYRCYRSNALMLLGSATPSAESMYAAKQGKYHLVTLKRRFNEQALPQVTIVDLKKELKAGAGGPISRPLRAELEKNLQRGEQSILFINRRGSSPSMTCGECGYVPECQSCSVHMTYHKANHRLMCHYCGHSEPVPERCPKCGGVMVPVGYGTQRVQEELEALFPGVEVMRMDADTISATQTHERLLTRFEADKVPILVGTQMVAKGLDFENVTLVGVISADQSLYVDDFRAGERTFSLLTQVVGRAGRGDKTGRAIIQTWSPDNEVIACAARQDYDSFYEQEIALRRHREGPPFLTPFRITATGPDEDEVIFCCKCLRKTLGDEIRNCPQLQACRVLGPSPAPVVKVNNRYRYRLFLYGQDDKCVREVVSRVVRGAQQRGKRNQGVSVYADLDPYD